MLIYLSASNKSFPITDEMNLYLYLMSTYNSHEDSITGLYKLISKWVNETHYYSFFKKIFEEYDSEHKSDRSEGHWKNSQARKLVKVYERLRLTDSIEQDIGEGDNSSNFWKRCTYPSLILYLRLTCFDQLGQPQRWLTFNEWLEAKKKKEEREQLIEEIKTEDKVEFAKMLYLKYQKIYGVRNSFYRFMREIISPETKADLLNLIKGVIHIKLPPPETREVTDRDKEDFLYKIRNDYTHNTYDRGPLREFQNKDPFQWNQHDIFCEDKEVHLISTHKDFEEKLKEVILIGIAGIINRD